MAFKNNPFACTTGKDTLPVHQKLPEASGQTFKKGELVYLASGLVTACADSATLVYGRALEDASGTANTLIMVEKWDNDTIVQIRLVTSGTALLNSDATVLIGNSFGYNVVSNVGYCDIAITNADLFVIDSKVLDATGAATYWVRCRLEPGAVQSSTGA